MNIIERVDEYLTENGLPHHIDEDGDMLITYQGYDLLLDNPGEDDEYFHLQMLNVYILDTDENDNVEEDSEEYIKILKLCNKITKTNKVMKAFIYGNMVILSMEIHISDDAKIDIILERCLNQCIETFDMTRRYIRNM